MTVTSSPLSFSVFFWRIEKLRNLEGLAHLPLRNLLMCVCKPMGRKGWEKQTRKLQGRAPPPPTGRVGFGLQQGPGDKAPWRDTLCHSGQAWAAPPAGSRASELPFIVN